jgi:hypothetical protein
MAATDMVNIEELIASVKRGDDGAFVCPRCGGSYKGLRAHLRRKTPCAVTEHEDTQAEITHIDSEHTSDGEALSSALTASPTFDATAIARINDIEALRQVAVELVAVCERQAEKEACTRKELEEYHKQQAQTQERVRAWHKNNSERSKQTHEAWRSKNREKCAARTREWRERQKMKT